MKKKGLALGRLFVFVPALNSPAADSSRRHRVNRRHEVGVLDSPELDLESDVFFRVADRLNRIAGDHLLGVEDFVAALDLADHLVAVGVVVFVGFGANMQRNGNGH